MLLAVKNDKLMVAAVAAAATARALLTAAEDLPYFGTVAKLINKLVAICDQCKCNKEAVSVLQMRFCRLADHLFGGNLGLAVVAQNRPNSNTIITTFIGRMEIILTEGIHELSKFTKGGFVMSVLNVSKPQKAFESLDQEMTQCLNELSVALQTTQLHEQAAMYNVVCNIQDKIDQRGGLEGLLADPAQLQWLATEIGAEVSDLQVEVSSALAALSSQVSVVNENVREIGAKMDQLHRAVDEIQKSSASTGTVEIIRLPQVFTPPATSTSSKTVSTVPFPLQERYLDKDFTSARFSSDQGATQRLHAAAVEGNHLAEAYLSILYGRGGPLVKKNSEEALIYAQKALPWLREHAYTPHCNPYAQFALSSCYHVGCGVAQDYSTSIALMRMAADKGIASALNSLGNIYYQGEGVNVDYAEAVKYYMTAAENGHLAAQFNLAVCYNNGYGVSKDYAQAVKFYKLAADQGNVVAQHNLGYVYGHGKGVLVNCTEAIKYYKLAADQGNASAQSNLGYCYANGKGVPVDHAEAVKYYKLAADQGHADAQYNLGRCNENGRGVPVNYAEAIKYYKLAAERSHTEAQFSLAFCCEKCKDVPVSQAEIAMYCKQAADKGHAGAQCYLGYCYEHGQGVAVNSAEAAKYYKMAADQGQVTAQLNLACAMIMVGVCLWTVLRLLSTSNWRQTKVMQTHSIIWDAAMKTVEVCL